MPNMCGSLGKAHLFAQADALTWETPVRSPARRCDSPRLNPLVPTRRQQETPPVVATPASLATSHGYAVEAEDGDVGEVETPLFPPAGAEPDFLMVRLANDASRFAVVSVQLISNVDSTSRRIKLETSCSAVAAMPRDIPLEY